MAGVWPVNRTDTDLARARAVAWCYREHLRANNRSLCDVVDRAVVESGETWVVPQVQTWDDDELVTYEVAAQIVRRDVETVRQWRKRGYVNAAGQRQRLEVAGLSGDRRPMVRVGDVRLIAFILRGR